jgi:hypothetical protein
MPGLAEDQGGEQEARDHACDAGDDDAGVLE